MRSRPRGAVFFMFGSWIRIKNSPEDGKGRGGGEDDERRRIYGKFTGNKKKKPLTNNRQWCKMKLHSVILCPFRPIILDVHIVPQGRADVKCFVRKKLKNDNGS